MALENPDRMRRDEKDAEREEQDEDEDAAALTETDLLSLIQNSKLEGPFVCALNSTVRCVV